MSKKTNTTNTTLTGPRSFKATLNRREKTKRHSHEVIVEAATFTFDASDAVMRAVQRALFADYTATAKELKLVARKESVTYGNLPQFTAPAFSPLERQWLGREVGFKNWSTFTPLGDGTSVSSNTIRGTVWSLSPSPECFWVYVEGQGFYSVHADNLLTGVNA